jgi:hypothetical protein
MADIENLAMAEPALARRRPIMYMLEEKVSGFFTRYKTANHGSGEEDDVVAVAAEPQEHARWIVIFVVTVGAVLAFCRGFFLFFQQKCDPSQAEMNVIFVWISIAVCLGALSNILFADCQDGFQDEDYSRLVLPPFTRIYTIKHI